MCQHVANPNDKSDTMNTPITSWLIVSKDVVAWEKVKHCVWNESQIDPIYV